MSIISDREQCVNPLNPKSDQNIISPYCNPAESFIKIVRIKEMIANLSSFDCETNSTNSYQRKCKANSVENMNADVRVQEVNEVFRTFMNSITTIHRS